MQQPPVRGQRDYEVQFARWAMDTMGRRVPAMLQVEPRPFKALIVDQHVLAAPVEGILGAWDGERILLSRAALRDYGHVIAH